MREIYECIAYVYDDRIQDNERLELVIYGMRHNRLM